MNWTKRPALDGHQAFSRQTMLWGSCAPSSPFTSAVKIACLCSGSLCTKRNEKSYNMQTVAATAARRMLSWRPPRPSLSLFCGVPCCGAIFDGYSDFYDCYVALMVRAQCAWGAQPPLSGSRFMRPLCAPARTPSYLPASAEASRAAAVKASELFSRFMPVVVKTRDSSEDWVPLIKSDGSLNDPLGVILRPGQMCHVNVRARLVNKYAADADAVANKGRMIAELCASHVTEFCVAYSLYRYRTFACWTRASNPIWLGLLPLFCSSND